MTIAEFDWNDLTRAADCPLADEVTQIVCGTAPQVSAAAEGRAVITVANAVLQQHLTDLPAAWQILGSPGEGLVGWQFPRPAAAHTLAEALCGDWLRSPAVLTPLDPLRSVALSLGAPAQSRWSAWRSTLLTAALAQLPGMTPTRREAISAGARLLQDDLDGSHACSQSIEGAGRYHTGDYWHAIMHRREPDPSNSKYWFRHVGSHPIFPNLASDWLNLVDNPRAANDHWPRLTAACRTGRWDPAAFVDACANARADDAALLQEMQTRELLRLWHWTCAAEI